MRAGEQLPDRHSTVCGGDCLVWPVSDGGTMRRIDKFNVRIQISSLQVTSTTLNRASASDGGPSDSGVQAIRNGQIADWTALERILHDALYMQVGHLHLSSEAITQS